MKPNSRRQFLKSCGMFIGGVALAPTLFQAKAWADPKVPLVDLKDPTAKAVKYVEDFKKVPVAKGKHCANCSFYKKVETRNGKEVGTCLIFAGKYVLADAYCSSWAKKS